MGVHKVNITGPKIIDKDMGVQKYHMWEVYEVNELCVQGCRISNCGGARGSE